jgi:hypothetical protein
LLFLFPPQWTMYAELNLRLTLSCGLRAPHSLRACAYTI